MCAFSSGLSLVRGGYQGRIAEDKVLLCGKKILSAFKAIKSEYIMLMLEALEAQAPRPLARQGLCPSYFHMEQEELGQTWNTARLYPREGTNFCLSYVGKCQRSAATNRFLQSCRSQSQDVQSCCTKTCPCRRGGVDPEVGHEQQDGQCWGAEQPGGCFLAQDMVTDGRNSTALTAVWLFSTHLSSRKRCT